MGLRMDIQKFGCHFTHDGTILGSVNRLIDYRNARDFTGHIGAAYQFVTGFTFTFFELYCFGAQHEMRKIDVPFVWRDVGALDLVAQITQIAFVNDLPIVPFRYAIDLESFGFIDQVKQGRECVAKGHTTPATVAYVINPLQLFEQTGLVIKLRVLPIQRMTGWRFKAAFS